ncbi:MAG: hypothetical protein N4A61_13805 [Pelagimonas sp.]|nr:hypothetical protein [Pelagimonas sp.]
MTGQDAAIEGTWVSVHIVGTKHPARVISPPRHGPKQQQYEVDHEH